MSKVQCCAVAGGLRPCTQIPQALRVYTPWIVGAGIPKLPPKTATSATPPPSRDVHLSSWIDPNFGLEIRPCGPRRLELFLLHSSTYHHRYRRLCEGRCPRRASPKIPCKQGTDPVTGAPLDVGACGMKPVGIQQANLQPPPPPEPVVKGQAVFHTDRSDSITVPETSVGGGECVNSFVAQSPVSFTGASIAGHPSNGSLDQPATTSSSVSRVQASRARTNTRSRSAAKVRPAPAARA
jgi:hypothetical protein